LPLVRGVLLLTWAAFLALLDALGGLLPGRRRPKGVAEVKPRPEPRQPSRTPRMPSLTPTGWPSRTRTWALGAARCL